MVPEGWICRPLEQIAKISSGGTPSRANAAFWGGNIPWVTTAEVNSSLICDTKEKITQLGLESSSAKLYQPGTILLAMYGQGKTRGQVAMLGIQAATNQACAAIVLKQNYDGEFYFYYLQSRYEYIRGLSNSGSQENLSAGLIKEITVPIPPVAEQAKIAKILSTWDKAITITEQILEKTQLQKKSLMQWMLTGKRRFADFADEWQKITLSSLIKEVKRPVAWDDSSEYKLLSVKRRSEGVVLREVLLGHQILTKKMNVAHSGDFLISKMQVVHGAMGLVSTQHHAHHISDSYICLIPKDEKKIDMVFFAWYCKQKTMYHKAYLCSYGVHIEKMTFNFELFLKEKIEIPPSIKEQQKIASALSTVDQEIAVLQQKLAGLKQEKKALLQQLLTGKRRVQVDALEVA
ncbi:restriction endonuclease subunit S [Pseudomonas sp. 32.2.56]|uniref:restriction endonuclease subunit S n=1 Tax=Pseudomonas sp. 32.2.56 TaxID=2969303 RepID=UPI00214FA253|nr:restriction endonuclease subunit S [Pseudomonas sp. 32.2.56]MCR4507781.1 restriction endonuclease subunit S [Pseudomonas sp. 32.2.56]